MKHTLYIMAALLLLATACKKDKQEGGKLPLQVKSFWPNSGNAGTIVHITGTGFGSTAADNEVDFNGTPARVVDVQDTVLTVLAPVAGTTGIIGVHAGGSKADAGNYTYQQLSLHGVTPANGPAGTNIRISGAGFTSLTGPAKVYVNNKEALVSNVNDTALVAIVPEAAGSGKIKVIVDGKEVEGPDFTFQLIRGIKPARGGKGTKVTINGEGFAAVVADNQVFFNGIAATVLRASATQVVAEVPDKVTTGPVSVIIKGQRTVGSVFTIVPAPVFTTVAPLSGPAGTVVTITGENFSVNADEVVVLFNGKPAVVETAAEKKITVKVPEGVGTGAVQLTVNDQATTGPEFKEQNLGVAALVPDNGLAGAKVIIQGVGFSSIAAENQISFNGLPAVVSAATATTLEVTVPEGVSTGAVTLTVNGMNAVGPVFKRAGVATLAGGPTSSEFNWIQGLAVDKQGNVFAVDNNWIKKVSPAGVVTVFAGNSAAGNVDGTGTDARFNYLTSMAIDANDNLYVTDRFNKKIRKITPAGVVSTLATVTFSPGGVAVDKNGQVYVGADYQGVYSIAFNGVITRLVNNAYESVNYLCALNGTIYYAADYSYNAIFRIAGGEKTTYAGAVNGYGFQDGTLTSALFGTPTGVVVTDAGVLYVGDGNAIRMIADGMVTTLTGTQGGSTQVPGYQDGGFGNAKFSSISATCLDKDGNLYVAERNNKSIRKVFFR
ncbi:hypothetical protein HNQ91_002914 [Filimonas zeae]|nr:IPT/TIG domain-containing protein [Filimonas zeae]MDR6339849.1 hypothetical protein [Filimonas zeae]